MADYSGPFLLLQDDLKRYHSAILKRQKREAWEAVFNLQRHIRELEMGTVSFFESSTYVEEREEGT